MADSTNTQGVIEQASQFEDTPAGMYKRWDTELEAGLQAQDKWHKQGDRTVRRFLDQRDGMEDEWFRLNLFYSNIITLQSMLFGKLPEITFDRTNYDFNDDAARVAAMALQRMLQADIGTPNDEYSDSLRANLQDRLLPGLGVARVRYEFDSEEQEVPPEFDPVGNLLVPGYINTVVTDERAPIEYVHWRDCAWSPCRRWAELRWFAFKTRPTRDELIERFGEEKAMKIPLVSNTNKDESQTAEKPDPKQDAWSRAEVWEIWCKESRKVYWFAKGCPEILDAQEDPLGLEGFFPVAKPMAANITTTAYMPKPDFCMAQDLYNEIDQLETRISKITEAVKVVGVYDKSAQDVERVFLEGIENDLIPVDNWAMWAEKGGMQGVIEWFPYETVAGVLKELIGRRNDAKAQLFEITGMSDIMRGAQAAGGSVTATERALEARFASVRVQALQDEFADYASDLIRLRAEVVQKHFNPETIIRQSNIEYIFDAQANPQVVQQAIELIKGQQDLIWRIHVKPESVSMVDYAKLQEERTSYITALATYLQSAGPMVEQIPESLPLLLEMLKWGLAGFKGSHDIEGMIDMAVQQAMQNPPELGEDENSGEMAKLQNDREQRQHDLQMEQMKLQNEVQLARIKAELDSGEVSHEVNERIREIMAETQQDIIKERAQMEANMQEETHETEEFKERERYRASLKPVGGGQ